MSEYRWLEELHEQHYAILLRLARNQLFRRVGTDAEAEDVVQEAFLLAARKNIQTHEAPVKWLMKTVVILCKKRMDDAIHEKKKQQRLIRQTRKAPKDKPGQAIAWQESEEPLLDELVSLEQSVSDEDWAIMHALFLRGDSNETVAKQHGMSVNALYVRLHRLRKKIVKNTDPM